MNEFLLDTSVIARMRHEPVLKALQALGMHRHHISSPTLLELGVTARNGAEHQALMDTLTHTFTLVTPTAWVYSRAIEVQAMLANHGQHRSARLSDLLIAAVAESRGMTVLHYDRDFDTLAKHTNQPTQWIVDAGSVD